MKTNRNKLSVKVDAKQIITENNHEYVRIKRKVIKRISRKPLKDPENGFTSAKTTFFSHCLEKIIGPSNSEHFSSANNPHHSEQPQNNRENIDLERNQSHYFSDVEDVQSEIFKSSELYLPLQF